jgi:WD40 repeat protein
MCVYIIINIIYELNLTNCFSGNFQTGMKINTIKKILPNSVNNNSKGHRGEILCLAISDDCKYLATSGRDKSIKLWNPENCEFLYSFEGHRDTVSVSSNYTNLKIIFKIVYVHL